MKYGKECTKNVMWKGSVQYFYRHLISIAANTIKKIKNNKYRWMSYNHFTMNERGKVRQIHAPHIYNRLAHKILTKEVLYPLYTHYIMNNNGASIKGKGLDYSRRELKKDLIYHFKKYGLNGWVISTDFKGFFPNANHDYIRKIHKDLIVDDRTREFIDSVLDTIENHKGLPLGVELSQLEMVYYPTKLDNYITCQLHLKGVGHYMDDYYILVPPDRNPYKILDAIKKKAKENCITINEKKTHIISFGKPFKFCKTKYFFKNGKLITIAGRDSAKRFRRKMHSFKRFIRYGYLDYMDLWSTAQSAQNYYKGPYDHNRLLSLRRFFFDLFSFPMDKYENFVKQQNILESKLKSKGIKIKDKSEYKKKHHDPKTFYWRRRSNAGDAIYNS